MATYARTLRRGLPRTPGGDPWPPAGEIPGALSSASVPPAEAPVAASVSAGVASHESGSSAQELRKDAPPSHETAAPAGVAAVTDAATVAPAARAVRRGLPRVPGGEPWPPASVVAVAAAGVPAPATAPSPDSGTSVQELREDTPPSHETAAHAGVVVSTQASARAVRRGLPRVPGGEPWPTLEMVAAISASGAAVGSPHSVGPDDDARRVAANEAQTDAAPVATSVVSAPAFDVSVPLPFTPTVWVGASARTRPAPRPEPARVGPFTKAQWAGAVFVGGLGLLFAAGMAVLAVRWLLSLDGMQDFLATYPGEYHLPEGAPVGFPAWLGWQHFFNVFLMVLIIRSGLTIRTEKRPSVFWAPRNNPKGKVSLTIWFHQSLDILWIVNGLIFVVLLFVTGQWMRIVPTSWEVIPNALSAALQYVSLDWPTENGWVNYNSLQQLAYFTTVFVAAPLAIITGVRMSGIWPKNAKALNKAYPVEWARKVHFPVMLYFVVFIVIHVILVFATGALRNLNHMYAATDADNWVGFWLFVLSLVVIAAAWVAARPLVLAPIARLFGTVSSR
ncbi:cytochrome b/b6 domain-containing protein [Microbacterium sp. NPDC076895]|uniref:cytochrome b/b6 domain-containing protein n=1 Tax=Microbacterium sp. NPDC076895 TaxID=3154957 RepID=UPI0034240D06